MKQKPITKRERMLMKRAFEAGRNQGEWSLFVHGNFKDFLHKNKYVAGRLYITPYVVKIIPI